MKKKQETFIPYKSVWYKSGQTRLTIIVLWVSFLFLLNYVFFVQRNLSFLVWLAILWFALYKIINITKNILYEFEKNRVIIHYWKNKKYIIEKSLIWRVKKFKTPSNFIGISTSKNVITNELYFTTSKQNMICFYMQDKRNIIISPRIIKKWLIEYYTADALADRFTGYDYRISHQK